MFKSLTEHENKVKEIKLSDTKWLFVEVLDDEHILIELHVNDEVETLRDTLSILIKNESLINL